MNKQVPHEPEPVRQGCHEFDLQLAEYLEGAPSPQVLAHAKSCPYCSVILADFELIRTESSSLGADPPAAVWASIRSTLVAEGVIQEPSRGIFGGFLFPSFARMAAPAAALACLAIVGAIMLVPPASLDNSTNSAWLTAADRNTVAEHVFKVEDEDLASTVSELEKSFEAQQALLPPSVKAAYQQGLRSLDDSIRECRESVGREPGNTLAREFLVSAYSQKAEVLAAALKYDVP
jgi:hypothetical protein